MIVPRVRFHEVTHMLCPLRKQGGSLCIGQVVQTISDILVLDEQPIEFLIFGKYGLEPFKNGSIAKWGMIRWFRS